MLFREASLNSVYCENRKKPKNIPCVREWGPKEFCLKQMVPIIIACFKAARPFFLVAIHLVQIILTFVWLTHITEFSDEKEY